MLLVEKGKVIYINEFKWQKMIGSLVTKKNMKSTYVTLVWQDKNYNMILFILTSYFFFLINSLYSWALIIQKPNIKIPQHPGNIIW